GGLVRAVGDRRGVVTVLPGRTGTVRVASVRLEEHAPARRDVAMAFDDYSVSDRLFLTGRVRWHELEGGPAIVRGDLKLAGKHGGRVRVHEQLQARERVGLSVEVEGAQLLLGQTPERLVTWVSTIAGDGTEGEEDGPIASARFLEPSGVAVADDGTIYVADRKASTVRVIAGGEVKTLTKDVFEPYDVGLDG